MYNTVLIQYVHFYECCTGGDVWIKLIEYPSETTFCPYQSMRMHCTHSPTLNQPDWIVENKTQQIFRSLNFKNGGLEHHRIVNDTTEVEVLLIDQVLPEFDGLLYCCQYDLYTGPLRSNYLTLNITGESIELNPCYNIK